MAQEEPDITHCRIPEDAAQRWRVVRDVIAGDQALRADAYLPTLNKSDRSEANADRNVAYRKRAVFYPATGFTLAGLLGLAFRHDPTTELPAKLQYLRTDCDGAGVSIYQQSQASLANVLGPGRHGLYTDFSSALARPIIKAYRAEDIINWREAQVGGKTVRVLVVLREDAEQINGYAVNTIDQWRELFMDGGVAKCRLWQLDADKKPQIVPVLDAAGTLVDEVVLRSSGAPLDEIPFDFIGSENNDSTIDPSPLYGLAQVNVAHFRNSADYEDAAFLHGQSQFWIAGLDQEWRDHLETSGTMYVGSRAPMLLPAGGGCGFAQAAPNMVAKEAMDQKEAQMVALGARLIDKTQAAKTATQAEGEREASTSILAMCCGNVSEGYQSQIARCARYLDLDFDASAAFKISQDFVTPQSNPQTDAMLVDWWQRGLIAKSDARAYIRRQGKLPTERSDEDIDAEIALQPPGDLAITPQSGAAPSVPGAPSAPAAPAITPQPDFGPLLASIQSLVSREAAAPVINVTTPDVVVNAPVTVHVPEQPASVVNIAPAAITVTTPDVHMAPQTVTFEPGSIAVTPAPISVEGTTVNMPAAALPQAPEPWQDIEFKFNEAGDVIGATRK